MHCVNIFLNASQPIFMTGAFHSVVNASQPIFVTGDFHSVIAIFLFNFVENENYISCKSHHIKFSLNSVSIIFVFNCNLINVNIRTHCTTSLVLSDESL